MNMIRNRHIISRAQRSWSQNSRLNNKGIKFSQLRSVGRITQVVQRHHGFRYIIYKPELVVVLNDSPPKKFYIHRFRHLQWTVGRVSMLWDHVNLTCRASGSATLGVARVIVEVGRWLEREAWWLGLTQSKLRLSRDPQRCTPLYQNKRQQAINQSEVNLARYGMNNNIHQKCLAL